VDQFSGLQLGVFLGAGRVRHQFNGVAINAVNWHEGQDKGVNLGFVNLTNNVQGLNWGAVNIAKGNALANVGAADRSGQLRRERYFPHTAADQFQEIFLRPAPGLALGAAAITLCSIDSAQR